MATTIPSDSQPFRLYTSEHQQQLAELARLAYQGRDMSTAKWLRALFELNPVCSLHETLPDTVLHEATLLARRPEQLRALVLSLAALGYSACFENDTTIGFDHPHGHYQVTFGWRKHLNHSRPQPHLWLLLDSRRVSEHWFDGHTIVRAFTPR